MVSIGNEITNGMLWSESEETNWSSFGCTGPGVGGLTWTSNTTATGWGNLAQLLKAGVTGAQAGNQPGHNLLDRHPDHRSAGNASPGRHI